MFLFMLPGGDNVFFTGQLRRFKLNNVHKVLSVVPSTIGTLGECSVSDRYNYNNVLKKT